MRAAICVVVLAIAGCNGTESLKGMGEKCVASSECEPGLLCDLAASAPSCVMEGTGSQTYDAAVVDGHPLIDGGVVVHVDAAKPDAPADGSGSGSGSGSGV